MSSSESDNTLVEDEEGKLYEFIYELKNTQDDGQSKEDVQTPILSELEPKHTTEDKGKTRDAERACLDFTIKKTTRPTTTTEQGQTEKKVDNQKKKHVKGRAENFKEDRNLKRKEEKPWQRSGADISDYFNFGFDEENWKRYRLRQIQLHAFHRELTNDIMGQKAHSLHEDKKTSPSSASRQSRSTKAVTGRRPGSKKQQRCISDGRNNTKGANKASRDEARLCSSSDGFLFRPAEDRSPSKHHNDPSASVKPSSSGVTALIPKTGTYSARVINASKAREHIRPQELCGEDGSREVWPRGDRRRGRERRKESASSAHSSHKEPQGHRDMTKQRHKHHPNKGERGNRKKKSHKDKMEEQEQSSHSSRRAEMDMNKGKDEGRSHKRKKSERKRDKNKEKRADRGRKLKSD